MDSQENKGLEIRMGCTRGRGRFGCGFCEDLHWHWRARAQVDEAARLENMGLEPAD